MAVARLARQPVARARRPAHRREAVLDEQLLELGVVRREELVQYAVGGEGQASSSSTLCLRSALRLLAPSLPTCTERARCVLCAFSTLKVCGASFRNKVRDGLLGVVGIWGVSSSGLLGEVSIWRVDE